MGEYSSRAGRAFLTMALCLVLYSNMSLAAEPHLRNQRIDNGSFASDIEADMDHFEKNKLALTQAPSPEARAKVEADMNAITAAIDKRAEEHPRSIAVQNSAARHALQSGDGKKALERAEQAVALAQAGGSPEALRDSMTTRSMAHYANHDFVGACADAETILKSQPQDVTAFELKRFSCGRESGSLVGNVGDKLARFLAQQSPFVAHTPADWVAMQKERPTADFASISASMQARKRGDAAAALQYAEAAVASAPSDPMAWAQRGLIQSDLQHVNESVLDLSRAIALGMVWNVLYDVRSQALLKGQQYRAAFEDASIALDLDPNDASAHATRGLAAMNLGNPAAEVLADFDAAAKLDPRRYESLLEQAKADMASRTPQQAAQAPEGRATASSAGPASPPPPAGDSLLLAKLVWGAVGLAVLFLLGVLWRRRSRSQGAGLAGREP